MMTGIIFTVIFVGLIGSLIYLLLKNEQQKKTINLQYSVNVTLLGRHITDTFFYQTGRRLPEAEIRRLRALLAKIIAAELPATAEIILQEDDCDRIIAYLERKVPVDNDEDLTHDLLRKIRHEIKKDSTALLGSN